MAGSDIGAAWHITASTPVSAYDMLPFGGASSYLPSAELVLPTTAWGTNYVAVLPRPTNGPAFGQIVAGAAGATVTIVPTTALTAGGAAPAAPQNVVTSVPLDPFEFVQWVSSGDMTGSVIQSTQPIEFIGGTGYLCMGSNTSAGGGCDANHQMIPPVQALGSEYAAPPYATRMASMQEESIPYRIVGTQAGTTLTYDPPSPVHPRPSEWASSENSRPLDRSSSRARTASIRSTWASTWRVVW